MEFENSSSGKAYHHSVSHMDPSTPEGCMRVRFSDWEYLPWNNSHNVVSFQTVALAGQARSNVQQVMFLIGGPANVLNMAVFHKQGLKDRVNLLLFALALADEVSVTIAMLQGLDVFYAQFSKTNLGLFVFIINSSIYGLQGICFVSFFLSALVACERCYCVIKPLEYQTLIRTRTLAAVILAAYVVILGCSFLVMSRFTIRCFYDVDDSTVKYRFYPSDFYTGHKDIVEYVDNIVFGITLQSGLLIVVITATVITVHKLRLVVAWRTETTSSVSVKEVALTKMLIGTSTLLIVCASPSGLLRAACLFLPELNIGGRYENIYFTCMRISLAFISINSAFNFFVYYAMGGRYRATFWSLFMYKPKRKGFTG